MVRIHSEEPQTFALYATVVRRDVETQGAEQLQAWIELARLGYAEHLFQQLAIIDFRSLRPPLPIPNLGLI